MWTKYKLEANYTYKWIIGNSEFYLKNLDKVISVKSTLLKDITGFAHNSIDESGMPVNSEWRNFVANKTKMVTVLPVMPNRPLLLKPITDIYILPERNCTIYVLIPVWIQFFAGSSADSANLLFEEPSEDLSGTWFGDPDNGILSYYFFTQVFFNNSDLTAKGHQVICPINIYNDSNSQLKIERLLIQTEYLKIFTDGVALVSNELKVRYKGESDSGLISFGKHAPLFAKDSKLLANERIQPPEGLLRKSFYFLKTGVGY